MHLKGESIMKRFIALIALLLILGLASQAGATGTCVQTTYTSTTTNARIPDSVTVDIHLVCAADASSNISYAIPMTGTATMLTNYNLFGYYLYQIFRNAGTTPPTASYSTTITDALGDALDLGLLATNGAAAGHQMNVIANSTTGYPVLLSTPTIAGTGYGTGGIVIYDLIFKAF
jgi:hypothetical protein